MPRAAKKPATEVPAETRPGIGEARSGEDASAAAPVIPENPSPAELEVVYAALRKAQKDARPINWFRQWPTKYLVAALPMWWLVDCGLVKPDGNDAETDCPPECSMRALADHLFKLFGKKVDKMTIQKASYTWLEPAILDKNGKRRSSGSLNRDIAVRLWRENVGGSHETEKTITERKNNLLRIQEEREQLALDDDIKSKSNKHALISQMQSAVQGFAAIVGGFWDRFAEDKDGVRKIVREAALRCGATEEFLLRLDAELAKDLPVANDAVKAQCELEGEKCFKRFEADRKEQLKQA